jgi:hypothetical protein
MKRKTPTPAAKRPSAAAAAKAASRRIAAAREVAADTEVDADTDADDGVEQIVSRPDGYHWLARDGVQEFGPFETLEDARADMLAATEDSAHEPAETLQEAELEIGIADWIDPETGEPAEGHSPPHLDEH